MKRILILTAALLMLTLAACGKTQQFSVTMPELYASHDPITLTVTLPANGDKSAVIFAVDGVEYAVTSMPTVDAPIFVFEDIADDGMSVIRLEMASDESEDVVLYMLPDGEAFELAFYAPLQEFSRLTDYLGTN